MEITNRVKELRLVKASELIPHDDNWRVHPAEQKAAMEGILQEVGWVGALLARETSEGLQLIDGHLRAEIAPDEVVPVLVVDVDAEEAKLILASYDPLSAMAETNKSALAHLLEYTDSNSEALKAMWEQLKVSTGLLLEAGKEFDESSADDVKMIECPHCGESFPA